MILVLKSKTKGCIIVIKFATKIKKPAIPFKQEEHIYTIEEIDKFISESVDFNKIDTKPQGKSTPIKYYNIPVSFDIETSNFYRDNETGIVVDYKQKQETLKKNPLYNPEKIAIMYVWQFGINGRVIIGRTWNEFKKLTDRLTEKLHLNENKRLIIYVHNLAFEFQFIRKLFNWKDTFNIELRKPIYAITETGLEFRCSLLLSGYSLAKLGEQLQKYKCEKMVGDLDYTLLRHSETELTEKEIGYCVNDVKVVMCYIQELIEDNSNRISLIPLTKTGFVRRFCREKTMQCRNKSGKRTRNKDYTSLIKSLNINNLDEFNTLQRAFQGGFTHSNAKHTGDVYENVASYDFTSSYPYVMISEKFPMSTGQETYITSKEQFENILKNNLSVFDITFYDLFPKITADNPISESKCLYSTDRRTWIKENDVVINNGRVVCAKEITVSITNIDFEVYRKFYSWKKIKVGRMYVYHKHYLPTELINAILELYENKTKLKGVKGKEKEYLSSKEMINSVYGMSVTNPLRDEILYSETWEERELTDEEKSAELEKQNDSCKRFLFYAWGVFVTAYARRNLFTGIAEFQDDYIYSDTDSIKVLNYENHKTYIESYNKLALMKLETACRYHGIDIEKIKPKTIKGVEKPLGVWDFEGVYTKFKTLGAKRYMVQQNNCLTGIDGKTYNVSLTVSGVNKKNAIPYLFEKCKGDENKMFNEFKDGLIIPQENTGKLLHTYIDEEKTGTLTDYTGKTAEFKEYSAVHLEPTDYSLSLADLYIKYLRKVKTVEL